MIIFENPNKPQQPQAGVYGWYAKKEGIPTITIYIGKAGEKGSPVPKGTLFRGVSELQCNTFTSNSSADYNKLDTDFIVGTALQFFNGNGYECKWRHISDYPQEELSFVLKDKPILQNENNTHIRRELKVENIKGYWKLTGLTLSAKKIKVDEAQKAIFQLIPKYIGSGNLP